MSGKECVSKHTYVFPATFSFGEPYLTGLSGRVNNAAVNRYRGEKQSASQKRNRINIMKKITSVLLGLSLTLATAGLSLAAQTPAAPADNGAPVAKKHVKKNKKAAKSTATTPATPAPPTAK
jgi:hypothetical protein